VSRKTPLRIGKLDKYRTEAASLKSDATGVLLHGSALHKNLKDGTNHLNSNSLAIWAIVERSPRTKELTALLDDFDVYLSKLHPQRASEALDIDSLSLLRRKSPTRDDNVSARGTDLLSVSRLLQALIRTGRHYSVQAFLCNYRILSDTRRAHVYGFLDREERESEAPIGAYVLNQCTHAYFLWKSALKARQAVIDAAAKVCETLSSCHSSCRQWLDIERHRLATSLAITILDQGLLLGENGTVAKAEEIFEAATRSPGKLTSELELKQLLQQIATDTERESRAGRDNIHEAISLCKSEASSESDLTQWWHESAVAAMSSGASLLNACLEALKKDRPADSYAEVSSNLEELGERLTGKMRPFIERFRSVLQEEQAHPSPNISELLSAAASYGYLTDDWGHPGLIYAIKAAVKAIGVDGSFPTGSPIDMIPERGSLRTLTTPQLIRLLCEIARKCPDGWKQLPYRAIDRLLRFFRRTRSNGPLAKGRTSANELRAGWFHEQDRSCRPEVWVTASVSLALGSLVALLDHSINQEAFAQFEVKLPREPGAALDLDSMMYADYGLAASQRRPASIAMLLQNARAHIRRVGEVNGRSHSFILHGPPGSAGTKLQSAARRGNAE
jgi:hypothetical protein